MFFFGAGPLRNAVTEFLAHFHGERSHQSLGNRLIEPGAVVGVVAGKVECRERLGGLLNYYYRPAASSGRFAFATPARLSETMCAPPYSLPRCVAPTQPQRPTQHSEQL